MKRLFVTLTRCSHLLCLPNSLAGVIVTKRRGHKITELNPSTFNSLVDQLRQLHNCGYLHMDVRPSNMLQVGGQLVLIDFGCALPLHEGKGEVASAYRGTLRTASDNVLRMVESMVESGGSFTVSVRDDLASACRSVLQLVSTRMWWDIGGALDDAKAGPLRWKRVRQVFERVAQRDRPLAFPFEAWDAAADVDPYDHVKGIVASFFPRPAASS